MCLKSRGDGAVFQFGGGGGGEISTSTEDPACRHSVSAMMGDQFSYMPLPVCQEDAKDKNIRSRCKLWGKRHRWCALFIAAQCVVLIVVVCVHKAWMDDPLGESRTELRKQISQHQAELASLRKNVTAMEEAKEKAEEATQRWQVQLETTGQILKKTQEQKSTCQTQLEKAEKGSLGLQADLKTANRTLIDTKQHLEKIKTERDLLQTQLASANQNLQKTQQQREACQTQLHTLEGKTTSLEAHAKAEQTEKQKLQEQNHQLQQQISSRESEWEAAQSKRDNYERLIQMLRDEIYGLREQIQQQRSNGGTLHGFTAVLFPLVLAKLLLL